MAHACSPPAEMAVTPSSGVEGADCTVTGASRAVVVPAPRRPWPLEPQHLAWEPTTAQAKPSPTATWVAFDPAGMPVTWTGADRTVVVPSPASPFWLVPQQYTPPALVTTQRVSVLLTPETE